MGYDPCSGCKPRKRWAKTQSRTANQAPKTQTSAPIQQPVAKPTAVPNIKYTTPSVPAQQPKQQPKQTEQPKPIQKPIEQLQPKEVKQPTPQKQKQQAPKPIAQPTAQRDAKYNEVRKPVSQPIAQPQATKQTQPVAQPTVNINYSKPSVPQQVPVQTPVVDSKYSEVKAPAQPQQQTVQSASQINIRYNSCTPRPQVDIKYTQPTTPAPQKAVQLPEFPQPRIEPSRPTIQPAKPKAIAKPSKPAIDWGKVLLGVAKVAGVVTGWSLKTGFNVSVWGLKNGFNVAKTTTIFALKTADRILPALGQVIERQVGHLNESIKQSIAEQLNRDEAIRSIQVEMPQPAIEPAPIEMPQLVDLSNLNALKRTVEAVPVEIKQAEEVKQNHA